MRQVFPAFKLVFDSGWWAVWEGPLTPICQTYQVRIRLITRKYFEHFYLTNSYEKVTILDPLIGPDPRGTGEPPQHVYSLGYPNTYPRLCVHDPEQEEWTPEMSIADVLIPMVIKWLIFHEDWVDTGIWRGGGRHPEPLPLEDAWQTRTSSPEDHALKEQSLNAAFHRLGRRLGVFGSYLWMAEGFEGTFPATVLAELERRYGNGHGVAEYFDLIAGTSTGGILALGLGAGLAAEDLRQFYVERGSEIFPERKRSLNGRLKTFWRRTRHWFVYLYNRKALEDILTSKLGGKLFGESRSRLCIPAFDGKHSEVFVYKTPHHKDYRFDRYEKMVTVGLATSAAPTYFQPLRHGGYQLVDGGVWANNPVMVAVVEALICFDITPDKIDVLTISCGEDPYVVSKVRQYGGKLFWADSIFAAMRLQSLAATNQARLLLGPPAVIRLHPGSHQPPIEMDDFRRAVGLLPQDAIAAVDEHGERIRQKFFMELSDPCLPVAPEE